MAITLGTDPEVFAFATSHKYVRKGRVVPAALLIPQALEAPDGGKVEPDGLAIEFTTAPSDDPQQITKNVFDTLSAIRDWISPDAELSAIPSTDTTWRHIRDLRDGYGTGRLDMFGCNPDFSVYDGREMKRPKPTRTRLRTTGGHIHCEIGDVQDRRVWAYIATLMDQTILTLASLVFDTPESRRRTELYGTPGTIRPLKRGILEYRSLPGQALTQFPSLSQIFFATAQAVANYVMELYHNDPNNAMEQLRFNIGGGKEAAAEYAQAIQRRDRDAMQVHLTELYLGHRGATLAEVLRDVDFFTWRSQRVDDFRIRL